MNDKPIHDWSRAHPDFDGHIEKPLSAMSVSERLDWLWQMVKFQHWAQTQLRRVNPDEQAGYDTSQ